MDQNRTEVSPFWERTEELNNQASMVGGNITPEPKKKSLIFKFLIGSLVLFTLAGAYAGYQVYSKRNQVNSDKIVMSLDSSLFADSGKNKDFQFSISNQNDLPLLGVTVDMVYERGRSVNGSIDTVRKNFVFGDVAASSLIATTTNMMMFGQEGDMRNIKIVMSYQVSGGSASYNKSASDNIKISAPLVTLELSGPSQIINENEFVLTAKIKNVAQNDFVPSIINFELPTGFVLKRNASSTNQTNIDLDALALGEERTFQIKGNFKNSTGESRTFRVYASAKADQGEGSQYASANQEVSIIDTPVTIEGVVRVESRVQKTASLGKPFVYDIKITNKGVNALDDIVVNVTTGGKTLTYDNKIEELKRINPNSSYTITMEERLISAKVDYKVEVYGKEKGSFDTGLIYTGTLSVGVN